MRKLSVSLLLLVVLAIGGASSFTGCATTSPVSFPGLAQLKPVAQAAVQIAVTQGKVTPAQATQINAALDTINGQNVNLATLGQLALTAAVSSGKISPAQAQEIQLIINALNAANAQAPAVPTPAPQVTP